MLIVFGKTEDNVYCPQ